MQLERVSHQVTFCFLGEHHQSGFKTLFPLRMIAALLNCWPDFRLGHSILMSSVISSLTELSPLVSPPQPWLDPWGNWLIDIKLPPKIVLCLTREERAAHRDKMCGNSPTLTWVLRVKLNLKPETQGNNNPSSPISGYGSQPQISFILVSSIPGNSLRFSRALELRGPCGKECR